MKTNHSLWALGWVAGLLLSVAGQPLPLLAQSALAPHTVPVILPLRGNVAGLFVTTGQRVKHGQLLAKLEQPNGQVFYVSAPAAGLVTLAALPAERPLPAHTMLAIVTVAAEPATQPR
jgi:biotin carboxyl carrier protein